MRPIQRRDLLSKDDYEARRDELRPNAVREKDRRRLVVGEHCLFLFETFTTLWYQVQEMIRAEAMTRDADIRHEMETYNELMPGRGELSATMLIQYPEPEVRDRELRKLLGIDEHVWLVAGDTRIPAQFDRRQMDTERVSSVQFIKFELGGLSADEFERLGKAGELAVEIDHEHMKARTEITGDLLSALVEDLRQPDDPGDEESAPREETALSDSNVNEFKIDLEAIRKRAREHMREGAITGAYRLDPKKVCSVLNEALATEIVCILRYKNHYFMASGINADPVAQEFLQHANEEQMHADWISARIVQLGGVPNLNPEGMKTRAHADYVDGVNLNQMIEENLVAERVAIEAYSEMINWLGNNDVTTRRILEDILKMEEEHADDLADMLDQRS